MMAMHHIHMTNDETSASQRRLASTDLNLLVALEAVLEEVSVTRAAQRVGLSQPAMSHALARARRIFGDQLLVRVGGRSVLTPRARRLRGPLRDVLRRTERLFLEGDFDPSTTERTITIAMSPSTAMVLGRRLTRLLAREAPGARLRALTMQRLDDDLFISAEADVMLMTESFDTAHPRERLYPDEWVVIGGEPGLSDGRALELLAEREHVVHEPLLERAPYQALRRAGVGWTAAIRLQDPLLVPRFVAGTPRVGVHRRSVLDSVESWGVWEAAFPVEAGPLGMDMIWNPWGQEDAFRSWLRGLLERSAPPAA